MVVRIIPVERRRCVEVWHDASADHRQGLNEDRVITVVVEMPRRARPADRGAAIVGWPAPILGLSRPGHPSD